MKRFYLISILLLFINGIDLKAQTYDIPLNKFAEKYYSKSDISEIRKNAPYKIAQINYLYSASFNIINQEGKPVKTKASGIDIYNYNKLRKQTERVTLRLTRDGDALELLSWDEVQIQYQLLKKSYYQSK